MKYASLWENKDAQRIRERKIFWVVMEMNIRMEINRKPMLSPTIYNSLQRFVEFKADFHHVFIKAWKEPTKMWHELPNLAINDVIFMVLESWPPKWHALVGSAVEVNKSVAQRKKEETKLWMA